MTDKVVQLMDPGLGVSFQDLGRKGWKRFGVPQGGALDEYAARWANRLLDNPPDAPVLELLLHGASFRALTRIELALTGAARLPAGDKGWSTFVLEVGAIFTCPV